MRYACGLFGGRFLHQVCAEVLTLSGPLSKKAPSDARSFCEYAVRMLQAAKPRKLNCGFEKKPILLFTDGCWEKVFAGIGAVIVDTASSAVQVLFFGTAPKQLLELWKAQIGEYIICQIEQYVRVLIRWQFQELLRGRHSVWWVDNDVARYCAMKGLSPSKAMRSLFREFYSIDASAPTYSRVERVPSSPNIPDGPSRQCCEEALSLLSLQSETPLKHPDELLKRFLAGL